jgi:hypothetical protein
VFRHWFLLVRACSGSGRGRIAQGLATDAAEDGSDSPFPGCQGDSTERLKKCRPAQSTTALPAMPAG